MILAVSGRPAFQGGAGEFVGLVQQQIAAEKLPMKLVCARRAHPIMGSVRSGRVARAMAEPLLRAWDRRRLHRALWRFGAQERPLLVFHPQSLGLGQLLAVACARSRPIWIFVLDASFFCRRSYNCLPGEWSPCFRCLGTNGEAAEQHGCVSPFPRGHGAKEQAEFRRLAQTGKFQFLVQTEGHARLLREHLGDGIRAIKIGLEVPGIQGTHGGESADGFDLVYHAAPVWEKGVGDLVRLARQLPEFRILAPFAPGAAGADGRVALGDEAWPANLVARPMTWASGLRSEVEKAKGVLCPSLWSAPVEGAVLKSLAHNGVVALFRERGQFGQEIPAEAVVTLAAGDAARSAQVLRAVLQDKRERERLRAAAAHYMATFRATNARVAERICRTLQQATAAGNAFV